MSENIPISNHGVRLVRSPLRLDSLGSIESTFILDQMGYRDPLELGRSGSILRTRRPARANLL